MSSKVEINVGGVTYPAGTTLGAMLRFKRETGMEVSEIGANDLSLLATYMWCCVKSGCNRDGIAFDLTLEDFADRVTPATVQAWSAAIAEDAGGDVEKKSR